MDLRAVLLVAPLFLLTAGDQTTPVTVEQTTATTPNPCKECPCPTTPASAPTASSPCGSAPVLGLLTVQWEGKCSGAIHLVPYHPSNCSVLPVCQSPEINFKKIMKNPCQLRGKCKGEPKWNDVQPGEGYNITESGANKMSSCRRLTFDCKEETFSSVTTELRAYKVVTGLLCFVFLVLLLIRFTRPTVTALQKRLSDRRQNRWVGPTQSHSVSYQRGKNTLKDGDGEMRLSFPALERLTIRDSRDSSSYNF